MQVIIDELPIILQNIEEDFEAQEDGEDKNTEIVLHGLTFICNTFVSIGMQNKILGQKLLTDIFDFFQYLSGIIAGNKYLDVYSMMLMLFEQICSNKS